MFAGVQGPFDDGTAAVLAGPVQGRRQRRVQHAVRQGRQRLGAR